MTTPAHDPTCLGASETAYDEGYDDAIIDIRRKLRGAGIADMDDVIDVVDPEDRENPYTKYRSDRIAYVEQQVRDSFTLCDEDGEDIFAQTDFLDAILDAHTDWLSAHAAKQPVAAEPASPEANAHLCQAMWQGRLCRCVFGAGHPGEHRCSCGDRREGDA